MIVPIQAKSTTQCSATKIHDICLSFRGPNGNPFGDPIPLQLKIVAPPQKTPPTGMSEIEMNKIAIQIFEMKLGPTFDRVIKAVEAANGDKTTAIQILIRGNE